MTHRQPILEATLVARAAALETLKALTDSQAGAELGGKDLFKRVTGQSSIENSIAATRRTIEAFDRVIAQLERGEEPPVITVPSAQAAIREQHPGVRP